MIFCGLIGFATISGANGERPKPVHPFDLYDHPKHFAIFATYQFGCENCHTDPTSYTDRTKINRFGCHQCHQAENPPAPAPQDCLICHKEGVPRPEFHDDSWLQQHPSRAKAEPKLCANCHKSVMFCVDCHHRRDNVQHRMHDLNFRLYHSIEARANPHKCDACHSQNFCTQCHAGAK